MRNSLFISVAFLLMHGFVLSEEKPARNSTPLRFPLPNPSEIGEEKFSLLLNTFLEQGSYKNWKMDLRPRTTGAFNVNDQGIVESFGIHGSAAVKVCYSPDVWDWMQKGRKGLIPDGGMIIKLLYARDLKDPTKFSQDVTGFSIMVKDSKGSWDGWYYSDGGPLQKPTHEHAATFFDPNAGFAISCINCHASADNAEGTYSSIRNVSLGAVIEHLTTVSPAGLKKGLIYPSDIHTAHDRKPPQKRVLQKPAPYWDHSKKLAALKEPKPLPFSSYDHVPQGPRPDGHRSFITSSNCNACHDAVQLNSAQPNMTHSEEARSGKSELTNLSASSEWRYSMMGLSGRDPVFYAQLESEREMYPGLADQIDNKCLSCHAVMGQRQFTKDKGPNALFTHKIAQAEPDDPHAKYGALSRDGVSCVVCHQMMPEGLGTPPQYSGNFKLADKPTHIFGPYEKVAVLPMQQAIGLTPQLGKHLSESKLCASCHTIALPVLDVGGKYSPEDFAKLLAAKVEPKTFHEQATYLEWKNSSFSTEVAAPSPMNKSCQDCHMPKTFEGERLKFRIANIEDDTFPAVDHRAPDDQLKMEVRDDYSRHALHGINLFVIEMFDQNPYLLGIPRKDNLCPGPNVKPGFDVAKASALKMAREQTATVKIVSMKREGGGITAQVQVKNLTGHKFPTGVNFRRAFIEFKIQAGDKTLWASGATDEWGVIGTRKNNVFTSLKSEFFTDQAFQPHHQTITKEDQVQIYEELVAGSDGNFTTSFLSLKTVVKDNRLLPHGWNPANAEADVISPAGISEDKDYRNSEGMDLITYNVTLDAPPDTEIAVSATLYYQSLPPYYLKRRFEYVDKPATQRLYYLVNQLDLTNTDIRDWKLKISQDAITVKK